MTELRHSTAAVGAVISLALVVAAAWLAVSTEPWTITLLMAGLGGLYLIAPPAGFVPRSGLLLAALLLLWVGGTALLPAAWFGAGIRQPFLDEGILLPGTFSAQPWKSVEALTFLAASLLWAWNCFEAKFSVPQRNVLLRCYLLALALVAVGIIIQGTNLWQVLPPFWQQLGRFPNRNQTGDLLLMGGIAAVALGLDLVAQKRWSGTWWLILAILFFWAMVQNGSRAAIILFALGLAVLFVFTPRRRHRRRQAAVVFAAILICGILLFAAAGHELFGRFGDFFLGREGRAPIYRDSVALVLHHPGFGVGLGNFEGFFNVARVASAEQTTRSIHPESDWLWLGAEGGLPAVILAALLIAATLRSFYRKTPFPHLTRISLTVAILFLLHSIFDVGAHRLGTMWNCLYLSGLGAFRSPQRSDLRIPALLCRAVGLLLLALAALRLQSASLHPWMPTGASQAVVQDELQKMIDHALRWEPLNWMLYYQRGFVALETTATAGLSVGDFSRALFLEQNSPRLPLAISEACLQSTAPNAAQIRRDLFDQVRVRDKGYFGALYDPALDTPNSAGVSTMAGNDPALQASAVSQQDAAHFDAWRKDLLKANPTLAGVPPAVARDLFDRWQAIGNLPDLVAEWPQNPSWQLPGWRAYATALTKSGRYDEAVTISLRYLPTPVLPASKSGISVKAASTQFEENPNDPFYGVQLYLVQDAAGSKNDALATLARVARLPQSPDYVSYLLAQDLHLQGQDQAAWQALAPLIAKP
jgi:O-antigen ligase